MSEALRFNEGKPSLAYILQFANPMKAIARIMEFGAIKYDDGNWRKGGKPDGEYLNSMMRHLTSWIHGEKYCKDSGCSHLGHAIWNLMALHELNHPDEIIDDEVFKRQCAYWKNVKEAGKKAEKVLAELDKEGPGVSFIGGAKVMTEADLDAREETLTIPAEYCDDTPPLQKNTVVMEIPVALRPEEGRQKGEAYKCPRCNSPASSSRVIWECFCGRRRVYHADSGLTSGTSGGEEQKEEEELEKGPVDLTFVINDADRCESFKALVQTYIRPSIVGRALEDDVRRSRAHSAIFEQWKGKVE